MKPIRRILLIVAFLLLSLVFITVIIITPLAWIITGSLDIFDGFFSKSEKILNKIYPD